MTKTTNINLVVMLHEDLTVPSPGTLNVCVVRDFQDISAVLCSASVISTYYYLCSYCIGPREDVDIRRFSKCTEIKHHLIVGSCRQKYSSLADANISL